jgi:predicted Rossmann fold flavoprotein
MIYDAIIIGGGPAGLMTANVLEKHNMSYLLLEKNEQCGKKLLISGGTRCNVTNHLSKRDFIEHATLPHKKFLYPMITKFGPEEVIEYFQDRSCKLVLENNFKYFPESDLSSSVLDALMKDIPSERIKLKHNVKSIRRQDDLFELITKDELTYQTTHLVIATGSNAYPHTGSSGDGIIFAKQLQIPYLEFTPAETHVFSAYVKQELKGLKGVSLQQTSIYLPLSKIRYQGDLLFTHFGLSGPVIMHLSEYIYDDIQNFGHAMVRVSLVKETEDEVFEFLQTHKQKLLHNALDFLTSTKIVETTLQVLNMTSKKIADMKHSDLKKVCQFLTQLDIKVESTATKEHAYVNKGGIDTKVLDPKTMQVKDIKGLYCIGEVTDLHGPIGGFNNTIAMSSGYLCAHAILESISVS